MRLLYTVTLKSGFRFNVVLHELEWISLTIKLSEYDAITQYLPPVVFFVAISSDKNIVTFCIATIIPVYGGPNCFILQWQLRLSHLEMSWGLLIKDETGRALLREMFPCLDFFLIRDAYEAYEPHILLKIPLHTQLRLPFVLTSLPMYD